MPDEILKGDSPLPPEIQALAEELFGAHETGLKIPVLPSARPGFDLHTAYAVESTLKKSREGQGHRSVGRKVGYANKAMWRVFKLETLVWAHIYEDTVHYAGNNAASLAIAHVRSLKIEPEIVFCLKKPITEPGLDAPAVLACVDWLALGFEVIDCPYPEWKFQLADFIASFGLHAALVVGEKMPVTPDSIPKLAEELPRCTVSMSKDGEFVEEGSGKNSLRSPALCLAELAGAISRRFPNEPLGAGELISSGTLTAGHETATGDRWTAEVSGIRLPSLTLQLK
jgi:2-oxo-3-hexenedioate decarboxylase